MSNALITGGGTGIGLACATALARRGYGVVVTGRRAEVLEAGARQVRAEVDGAAVVVAPGDVAARDDVERAFELGESELGPIDALVTSAASYEPTDFLELEEPVWDEVIDVVLKGTFLPVQAAARRMRDSGAGGRIVMISSICATTSEPDAVHYNAAKAGVSSMARSLSVDLTKHGIVVNAVAPSWVRTAMTEEFLESSSADVLAKLSPLGRAAEPEEIADVVRYLLVEAPPMLTGTTVYVDGGQTVMAPML